LSIHLEIFRQFCSSEKVTVKFSKYHWGHRPQGVPENCLGIGGGGSIEDIEAYLTVKRSKLCD